MQDADKVFLEYVVKALVDNPNDVVIFIVGRTRFGLATTWLKVSPRPSLHCKLTGALLPNCMSNHQAELPAHYHKSALVGTFTKHFDASHRSAGFYIPHCMVFQWLASELVANSLTFDCFFQKVVLNPNRSRDRASCWAGLHHQGV